MYQSDLNHPSASLQDKLEQLYRLSGANKIDLNNDSSFQQLLSAWGNPHLSLPPVIHVAGTNGKGSVIAMLKAIYEAGGYSVHVLTSPHLIRFNERIVLNGAPIGDDVLEGLIDTAITLNSGREITFFAITTAIAFAAFSTHKADICLVEVGLGGAMDSTNVIPTPVLSIINKIGLDHTEFLGNTLPQIAREKAGIIKPNVPCVYAPQNPPEVIAVFDEIAGLQSAPLIPAKDLSGDYAPPALSGAHQVQNANVALSAAHALQAQFPITDSAINAGLRAVEWPARLQKLPSEAFGFDPAKTTLWLDGGHNADAGRIIAAHLNGLKDDGGISLILCMMRHKDPAQFVKPFIDICDDVYVTTLPDEPMAMSADDLYRSITRAVGHKDAHIVARYQDALADILNTYSPPPAHILITGSLYLAGTLLHDLEKTGHTRVRLHK